MKVLYCVSLCILGATLRPAIHAWTLPFLASRLPELECRLRRVCLVLMCTPALQVKGYLQHLSRMNLTVDQLSKTGIGKRLRSITKWGNQRKSALEPMPAAQEADPETGNLPERRSSWELAT